MGRVYFKWTPEAVERLRALLQGGHRLRSIASELGCTKAAVARARYHFRLPPGQPRQKGEKFSRRPATPPWTNAKDIAKAERMIELMDKCARLRSFQRKAA